MAFALFHLSSEQFELTPVGVFWEMVEAYRVEKDAERQHLGELVRGATLRLWNLQVSQKSRIHDPSLFWPMPWDAPRAAKVETMTKEERDAAARVFLEKLQHDG